MITSRCHSNGNKSNSSQNNNNHTNDENSVASLGMNHPKKEHPKKKKTTRTTGFLLQKPSSPHRFVHVTRRASIFGTRRRPCCCLFSFYNNGVVFCFLVLLLLSTFRKTTTRLFLTNDNTNNVVSLLSRSSPQQDYDINNSARSNITSSPFQQPPSPQEQRNDGKVDHDDFDDDEVPHVPFGDWKYRRVCTKMHHHHHDLAQTLSTLCMMVRFPFELEEQVNDPNVTFPKPVDPRMYKLRRSLFIDGPLLDACRLNFTLSTTTTKHNISHPFHACLEWHSQLNLDVALILFSRRNAAGGIEDWYGLDSDRQRSRMQSFFENQHILFLGASPTHNIAACIGELFGTCQAWQGDQGTTCDGPHNITLQVLRYEPPVQLPIRGNQSIEHRPRHMVSQIMPLLDFLRSKKIHQWATTASTITNSSSTTTTTKLRPMSIIVEFPLAHMQTQDMIFDFYDQVQYNQDRYTQIIMNLTTLAGRNELAQLGFDLKHVIAFDGLPQHFPTETGGYTEKIHEYTSETDFVQHQGYPGWRPELGSSCRGPLPRNSRLKQVNDLSRQAFIKYGLDRNWYGKTWEFHNQFWFQEVMWRNKKSPMLDCVHTIRVRTGLTCLHKYFVQAMVDGYYEAQEIQQQQQQQQQLPLSSAAAGTATNAVQGVS